VDLAAERAEEAIGGYTILNDRSARDLQRDEQTVNLGPAKGKDSASSLGPWIVTRDEMAPYYRNGTLHVQCTVRVNGVVWMDGMDIPLIQSLESMFFEMYDTPQVPLVRENNASQRLHAHAHIGLDAHGAVDD